MKAKNECDELYAQVKAFEETAAHYRSLVVKPSMTENQRRYIVQANALSQQKEYAKAISQYEKALALGVTSYPAAFYNMALLAAQEGRHCAAIANMKKYLLLEPEAKDARSAQDKIYEWEMMAPQPFDHMATTQVSTELADAFLEMNFSESGKPWSHEMIDLPRTVAAKPSGAAGDANFLCKEDNCTVKVKIGKLPN